MSIVEIPEDIINDGVEALSRIAQFGTAADTAGYGRRYVTRPQYIYASQFIKDGDHPEVMREEHDEGKNVVFSLKGSLIPVKPGDWIIRLPNGVMDVLSPEDFDKTYWLAGDLDPAAA